MFGLGVWLVGMAAGCDGREAPVGPTAPASPPQETEPPPTCRSREEVELASWDGLTHLVCAPGTGRCASEQIWRPWPDLISSYRTSKGPKIWRDEVAYLEGNEADVGKALWLLAGYEALPASARSISLDISDPGASAIRVACAAGLEPSLSAQSARRGNLAEVKGLSQRLLLRSDAVPAARLMAGSAPFDGAVVSQLPTASRVNTNSETARLTITGDCGTVDVLGSYSQVVVEGWHAHLDIFAQAKEVEITLYPGSHAIQNTSIVTTGSISLSVPARSGYRIDVPAGWQVVCPEGLDPACGRLGPRRVGSAGASGVHLAAPAGVLRIYDWVGDGTDSRGDELLPLAPNQWLRQDRFTHASVEPPCRDVLRRECGTRSNRECIPLRDVKGRLLAPWHPDEAD